MTGSPERRPAPVPASLSDLCTTAARSPPALLPPLLGAAAANPLLLWAGSAAAVAAYAASLDAIGLAGGIGVAAPLAVLAASALSSIAGFAFSAICGAMLLHLLEGPVRIVQILILCSIAIQSLSVWALRRDTDWRALPPFLAGGVLGLPGGVWLLLHLDQAAHARLIGLLLAGYALHMLLRRRPPPPVAPRRQGGPAADALAGLLGGVTGGLAGFPGAFVTIWCGMKGWDKARQRGVYQPFILIMQLLALGAIQAAAPAGSAPGLDAASLACLPAALLGTCCGLAVFRRLDDRQFGTAVALLLLASGLGLVL
jgi:uncharacterized membrane protein YfcA